MVPMLAAILFAVPLLAAQTGSGQRTGKPTAVQTMAGVLLRLNHFPTDAEKANLKMIVDDKIATEAERTVAQALINVQHKVAGADAPKLQAIVKDPAASESVKTLAAVILSLNHTPTDADKEKLKKIAS
jgi:hypothetical protein